MMSAGAEAFSPYSPTAEYISGDYAVPYWFKYVMPGIKYSENFKMLGDKAGFPTPESLQDWTITIKPTSSARVTVEYDTAVGNLQPGSGVILFTRDPGNYRGDVAEVHFKKQFSFPYNGPPKIFDAEMAWLAEGIESLQQVELTLSIQRLDPDASQPTNYALWVHQISTTSINWEIPDPKISSYDYDVKKRVGNITQDPAITVFKPQTEYIYDLRIKMTDSSTPGPVEATIHFDDLDMKFYGTAFGLLGTDMKGRDIYSQLTYGSRISLFVGLLSALLSVVIGLGVGLIAGYMGRAVDELTMRFTDMLLVLPSLPLLIVLIAVLGPSIFNLIMLIGVLGWMGFARVVRSQVLSLKERPFVEAAKAVGAGKFHIIIRHVLPNVMSLVYVTLALSVPSAILSEAALSWLGLFDPTVVSWGRMLNEAQNFNGIDKWWWIVPPGISIALVSLSFVLLGYALDDILNPKLRQRR
jgi:ABC-type dipeptide/oligopeptide/nickel transport system permease subunit